MLLTLQPIAPATAEPIFDIVLCSDTIRFNKGEDIEFNLYFVGMGDVVEDVLLFYVNDEIYVSKSYIMGGEILEGLQDQGTNMQKIDSIMPNAKPNFIDYNPDQLNPLYSGTIGEDGKFVPPLNITLTTGENVSSGEHIITTIYSYKGDDGIWRQASDELTFYITTEAEEIEYEFMMNEQQFSQLNQEFSNLSLEYQKQSNIIAIVGALLAAVIIVQPTFKGLKKLHKWYKNYKKNNETEQDSKEQEKTHTKSKEKEKNK